jgi:hypothetical protein
VSRFPFHPEAEAELRDAPQHYTAVRLETGIEFFEEVDGILQRIVTFPEHGSPYKQGTWRVVMKRFPFSIVYLHEQRSIVVAVAHQRRRPGYWLKRLKSIR